MEELLRYILEGIASKPEEINIESKEDGDLVTYYIEASEEDTGRIIGREGRTIKAIQTILTIPARKQDKRIFLKVGREEEEETEEIPEL